MNYQFQGAAVGRGGFSNLYSSNASSNGEFSNSCYSCLQRAGNDSDAKRQCYIPSFDSQAPCDININAAEYASQVVGINPVIYNAENPYYSPQGDPLLFGP